MGDNLAMKLCPCGYFSDPKHECGCSAQQIHKYRSRISGPLLDRIDIHVNVPAVPYKDLIGSGLEEPSATIQSRVAAARIIQSERFSNLAIYCNAQMSSRQIRKFCQTDVSSSMLLESAIDRLGLSARAYNRVLKISRTIADLEACPDIRAEHVAEAIQYRSLDRGSQGRQG
jgi:magnesium chelatase family protein